MDWSQVPLEVWIAVAGGVLASAVAFALWVRRRRIRQRNLRAAKTMGLWARMLSRRQRG